jgi:enhancing lycopene biosynthesis protein 2
MMPDIITLEFAIISVQCNIDKVLKILIIVSSQIKAISKSITFTQHAPASYALIFAKDLQVATIFTTTSQSTKLYQKKKNNILQPKILTALQT